MKRYDKNDDRKLKFSEFCSAFTPVDARHADMLNARHSLPNSSFSQKTMLMYRNLWNTHIKIEQ